MLSPFSFAKSIVSSPTWLSWLSKTSKAGLFFETFIYLIKCLDTSGKNSLFIHPDGVAIPRLPFGAPVSNNFMIL